MKKQLRSNRKTLTQFKLLFLLFCVILVTTGVIAYRLAARSVKGQLAQRCHALAATAAVIIAEDSDGYAYFLQNIDMNSEYYQDTKRLMMALKAANAEHVTYIYTVTRVDENTAMYVFGGETPESPVYTGPGVTDTMSAEWRRAFDEQRAVLENDFVHTPYGVRLSAYAPIFHRETGEFLGLVGADVVEAQYGSVIQIFIVQTAIGLLAGLIVFAVALWWLSGSVNVIINKERYEAAFARKIVSTGREHYQKMDALHDKLRILRHDYKYHLGATRYMLRVGDAEGADRYLTEVEERLSAYDMDNFCTNPVLNALIAEYAERCAKLSIRFRAQLDMPKALSVPDYDLCIILGNLLENAISACEHCSGERSIELETQSIPHQLLFMVKNTFDGEIHQQNGLPVSEKANGGFGLRSVQEVIDAYNGDFVVEWDARIFTVYIAVRFLDTAPSSRRS